MDNTIFMKSDGPDVDGFEVVHEFKVCDDFEIWIMMSPKKEFFASLDWENIGPFHSKEKAIEGICKKYYEDLQRKIEILHEIEKLSVSD